MLLCLSIKDRTQGQENHFFLAFAGSIFKVSYWLKTPSPDFPKIVSNGQMILSNGYVVIICL